MRFRKLDKWDNTEDLKGLVFVAQLIDELLFEYTLDTYKPSAMNTSLLVIEACNVIGLINKGVIKQPNLRHILDELCENLLSDDVARSLVSVNLQEVVATLKNNKTNDHDLKSVLELLKYQVPLYLYKEQNEKLLLKELSCEFNETRLRSITRSYITTLLNFGFSEFFIKRESRKFFFDSSVEIKNVNVINRYFELFRQKPSEFCVVYKAPKYFKAFKKPAEKLKIKILSELPEFGDFSSNPEITLKNNEIFLITEKLQDKDIFIAKKSADKKIEQLQTLIGLYHHKESPKRISESLVIDFNAKAACTVKDSLSPMHKCKDLKTNIASKRLDLFIKGFSMQKESFIKFNRAAELHALALSSESRENQMINLWIALESLIPTNDSNKVSNIEHICNSIIPFLNLGYVQKLLLRLSKDLKFWNESLLNRIYRDIDAEDLLLNTLNLLIIDDYEDKRKLLEESCNDYLLLSNRLKYISKLINSPKKIVSVLESHQRRVEWQIRRIYRARNMIVHEGVTPSYIEILIENTHDYLDTIMSSIMSLASFANSSNSIDQSFKMVELNYNSYFKSLSEKGLEFKKSNIENCFLKYYIKSG